MQSNLKDIRCKYIFLSNYNDIYYIYVISINNNLESIYRHQLY